MAMVNRAKIKELLNESACSHSKDKKPGEGCDKPKPGLAAGGCAFDGAQISLFPYADAVHLVHGPQTCLGASWETRESLSSYNGRNHTFMGFTTGITTNDVIFGGDKRLEDSIDYVVEHYKPEAIFVYSTCVTALVGDDIDMTCKLGSEKHGVPVVPVHAPGFVGGKNLGSRLAGEAVLEHLIGTKEPEYTTKYDINLIGDYNVTGDMWQYMPMFEKLGIRVLASMSGDGRVGDIRTAHRAKLNVIVCAKSLVTLVRKMNEKWDIPWVSVSFYGKRDTTFAIREIVKGLGDPELMEKAERLIDEEEAKLDLALEPYRRLFKGKKAVLNTGGNKAWSIASGLQDLGIEVVATSIKKSTADDIEKAREYLGEDGVLMDKPAAQQSKVIDERGAHILLAGGRSLYTAIKKKISFIDVNQEKKTSYGGYNGLINLAEDLKSAFANPVFANVSAKAPWEVG
ncbi:nitrogenase iron-molybdenum cofactor biosynthesis protein NifE [Sulfurimonas sp. HSL-3221]|uniref:nitrogenase iron-molybdenum cofactor biosynthesis protein NifE n=1 Tax=Sulfurimonadaceae TaxID=2771471 RepID=UPI001E5E646E|nr:nitrogenase iron-molybdenum cofactor biosynthesis protein NifE [Sulfurimonas sp. HSL-3221]UFS61535.1 nitrogenase iron-molybdenum cofactor biosynthesis protein NifE [Sulfurimonas sp. HSL-3221]